LFKNFPTWFSNKWWQYFSLTYESQPQNILETLDLFALKKLSKYVHASLHFISTFGVPWIICWDFIIMHDVDEEISCYPDLMRYVATQFLTHVLINFQKNPKIAKKHWKSEKYIFNTFASFLAFLASSQKNLNFQRHLERVQLLTRYF